MEASFVDNGAAVLAVPAHAVDRGGRSLLLEDDTDSVGEAHGVVRRVGGEEKHVALANDDVAEDTIVDDLEHHGALVLIEPLGGLVDVVVGTGVGAADNLDKESGGRGEPGALGITAAKRMERAVLFLSLSFFFLCLYKWRDHMRGGREEMKV